MISCYQFKTIISRYIDKDISFQNRKSFEEHMDNCPGCKELYQLILGTKISMNQFSNVTVSDNFLENLKNKILTERNAQIEASLQKGFSFSRIPSFVYGFAAALVVVIIGFYLIELQPSFQSRQMPPQIVQEKIQKSSPGARQYQSTPPLLSQGQMAASESVSDSIGKSDDNLRQSQQDFQNKIKTVKEEY